MITEQKAANVFRGKTARACESCVRKRARWYCAADDAFLCHGCDALFHSANQLAGSHERIRLEAAAPYKVSTSVTCTEDRHTVVPQAWYNGFTSKARTPRSSKTLLFNKNTSTLPVVPELVYEEQVVSDESDDLLLYKVPVFDPFEAEICNIYSQDQQSDQRRILLETKREASLGGAEDDESICALDNFSEFLPSDVDLAEFAADVESLLTKGHDNEDSSQKQDLEEPVDCEGKEAETAEVCTDVSRSNAKVKEEDEGKTLVDSKLEWMLDMTSGETISWNFDYESLVTGEEEDYKLSAHGVETNHNEHREYGIGKKNMLLRLNYDEVITAWASQDFTWNRGQAPEVNPYSGRPDCLGTSTGSTVQHSCAGVENLRGISIRSGDSGREARVSRYREKRRTRLFAKKIRYEVRKLNAESRPRMKGRFVKRTSFMGAATSFPYN